MALLLASLSNVECEDGATNYAAFSLHLNGYYSVELRHQL